MSNILKSSLLTSALGFMSVAASFGQNKSDMKVSGLLRPDRGYSNMLHTNADSSYNINYQGVDRRTGLQETLTLYAKDFNGNGVLEVQEVTAFDYESNLHMNSQTNTITVNGDVMNNGEVKMTRHRDNGIINGTTEETAPSIQRVNCLYRIFPQNKAFRL